MYDENVLIIECYCGRITKVKPPDRDGDTRATCSCCDGVICGWRKVNYGHVAVIPSRADLVEKGDEVVVNKEV